MKSILKYTLFYIITLTLLFLTLILATKIPKKLIEKNVREASSWFDGDYHEKGIIPEKRNKKYTYKDNYADAMILNIIYNLDENNPIKSAMEAKYYSIDKKKSIPFDFNEMIDNNYKANVEYMRYWHGSISIIKPLLVFFTLNQIYIINTIVLGILLLILLILLIKTKIKELAIAFVIGIILCMVAVVPFCLEYYWTFLIMTIASIVAIILEKKNKNLNVLFLITGMLTCYLDFLTTELITLFVPLIIILAIKYKEDKIKNLKDGLKISIILSLMWTVGYVGMWLTKWLLASIILKVNALDYVKEDIKLRITGGGKKGSEILAMIRAKNIKKLAILENVNNIFIFELIDKYKLQPIISTAFVIFMMIFIRKKDIKKLWFSGLLLVIATVPYIRYAILAQHSYAHSMFTFRSQIITIVAVILAVYYSIDKDIAKKSIKIRRKKCT